MKTIVARQVTEAVRDGFIKAAYHLPPDVEAALQKVIDDYNQGAPLYKRIYRLKIRDTEFEKTTSRKIKRF